MYMFLIMPQKRREKQHRAMLGELKKNDHVVTAGGIHGVVMSVKEGTVVLKIDEAKDVKITVNVGSIAQVVPKGEQAAEQGS
jgi:preprotein translocase subunit YajC